MLGMVGSLKSESFWPCRGVERAEVGKLNHGIHGMLGMVGSLKSVSF